MAHGNAPKPDLDVPTSVSNIPHPAFPALEFLNDLRFSQEFWPGMLTQAAQ
jgi:hypothetical protein